METTAYTCPHCGKPILLPEGLTEFSCMYCGVRMTLAQLLPTAQESAEAAAILGDALPGMITGYPQTMRFLTAKAFPAYFEAYVAQHLTALQMADSLSQESSEALCADIIDKVYRWCTENKTALRSTGSLAEDCRFTLCLVTVPAILQCAPERGMALAEGLRSAWEAKYGSAFQIATYETIAAGFRKKGLCFITTAACQHLGKADDCAELTAFRRFRDTWLANQPGGQALIEEYYRIAPTLVTLMDHTGDPEKTYHTLWQQYLQPCYDALNRGDNESCFRLYCQMVRQLKVRYLKEAA